MAESKKIYTLIILTIVFLIALYLALFAGYKDSGIHLLFKSFDLSNDADSIILTVLRYPRVLKGFIAGSCLALAGLFMQAVSKNPLAEPYLTGVSSGAGLGIVISVIYFNSMNYSLFGFAGALISSAAVILFAGISRFSAAKMILTGLSVNLFASSLISLFILMHADKSHLIMFILSGGFNSGGLVPDKTLFAVFSAALAASCFVIPKLNFLRLDENMVLSFKKEVYLIIILSAFLTCLSVFAAGILGFIGIIAPQIAKKLVGNDYRYLFFANILIGGSFILFADYLSRTLVYPLQIPLGLVIAFIGAPVFVFFLTKKGDIFDRN